MQSSWSQPRDVGRAHLALQNEFGKAETSARALRDAPTAKAAAHPNILNAFDLADQRPATVGHRKVAALLGDNGSSIRGVEHR
jgi:hypothetical protein